MRPLIRDSFCIKNRKLYGAVILENWCSFYESGLLQGFIMYEKKKEKRKKRCVTYFVLNAQSTTQVISGQNAFHHVTSKGMIDCYDTCCFMVLRRFFFFFKTKKVK